MRQYDGVSVPDDQIYERYQARAIAETNELGHDIATWVGEHHPAQAPVIGTGYPLADIFLLKYRPMPAEVQEGVAFFGRAGQAVLKSIERLRIDPLKLYGSVCLKVDIEPGPEDLEQSRAWADARAAHHAAGQRGGDGPRTPSSSWRRSPSRSPARSGSHPGRCSPSRPTIDLLAVPDIDDSLNDSAAKRAFWSAFKALGEWYDNLPPY